MGSAFALVLHTHLPMVLNHGRWPHGSDWLCEAAFECYLPLLETAHRLVADGISPKWTINLSPILSEQLASPEFQKELSFYYENVRRACVESRAHFEAGGNKEIVRLTSFWEEFYERMWEMHRRIGGDIPGTFAELQRGGHVEMITCAATHGYLPLLGRDESIHLQLRTAVETHRRHFGQAPRGIWLPECAYRPRYEWTPPTGRDSGRVRWVRAGIEELLAGHGLEYFVADAHLVSAGAPVFLYRDFVPLKARRDEPASSVPSTEARSPYAPYRVASRGGTGAAIAFFRDPKTTLQVWSREHGYPGDYAYLEFHKKHFPGGLRFWRITDSSGDLGRKIAYDPALAAQKVGLQARHFVELVTSTLATAGAAGPAVVCSPYDAELFGHWWFEGPLWLEQVAREMARGAAVTPATLGEALAAVEPRATLALPEGSWGGRGGSPRASRAPPTTRTRCAGSSARTSASPTSSRRGAWARPGRAERDAAAGPGPRDDHGRRQGRAAPAAHPRALQVGGAVRRAVPARRFRAVELHELRAPVDLRPRPVQIAVAHRAPARRVADERTAARLLRHGRPAPDALRVGLVPGHRRRRAPEPEPDRRLQRRRDRDLRLGPHLPDGRGPDARLPPGGRRRRHDRHTPRARRARVLLRRAARGSAEVRRRVRGEASGAGPHARHPGLRPRLDGQLSLFAPGAHRRPPRRRAAVHGPRLRPLDHPGAGGRRARLRLRLPDERGAGGEALRGARVLARRRHDRGLLGGPHGPPLLVAGRRSRPPLLADPERASSRPGRAVPRRGRRQRPDRRGVARQARHDPQLDPRPERVGERGRRHRGLDRHGPHDGGQGRPAPARDHRPLQHHPRGHRDRYRSRAGPAAVLRRPLRARRGAARRPSRVVEGRRRILTRSIVIHGHFYQPPRENPWLESVEVQDGAAPFHDWNERVTAECYAPNTAARRVDEQNRILDIVNNFEKISFNAGPTLLAWLDRHRPDVCAKIVAADRASVTARGGHGNAIAQVYNHMIMPLALRRDKVTQVRWGVEDFRARFGREPEGCWLPVSADDYESVA